MTLPYIPLEFEELASCYLLNECLQWVAPYLAKRCCHLTQYSQRYEVIFRAYRRKGAFFDFFSSARYSSRYSVIVFQNNPSELGFPEATLRIRKPRFGELMKFALGSIRSRTTA